MEKVIQHLGLFPEPSYWTETFLSTAGTAVPIFLQPWFLGPFGGPWWSRRVPWALLEFHNVQKGVLEKLEGLDYV